MREIYIILGWIGWIWLACVLIFAAGYFKGQCDERRRVREEVIRNDEKQS